MRTISSLHRFRPLMAVTALACPLMASQAQAALIAYENFESYTPSTALNGQNGGTGWTSAWTGVSQATVQTKTLVDPNGLVSGGSKALRLSHSGSLDIVNAFGRTFAPETGTFYVSYQLRVESFEDQDFVSVILSDNVAVAGNVANTMSSGVRNVAGNPIFSRVASSTAGQGDTDDTVSAPDNVDFLIVTKYSKVSGSTEYNQTAVYVNPVNLVEPGSPSAVSTFNNANLAQISALTGRFRPQDNADIVYLDSFRVATTFAEALGSEIAPKATNATITAFADSYVQSGTNGGLNFGNNATLQVKHASDSEPNFNRKAYMQFDVSNVDLAGLTNASFEITVAGPVSNTFDVAPDDTWTFELYGLRDDFVPPSGKLDEGWSETAINGNNAPGNDTANGGAVNAADVFGGTLLDTFDIIGGGVDGTLITLDSQLILDFLKTDTDGLATFILVRTTQEFGSNNVVHTFHSSESTANVGPRLNLSTIIAVPEPSVAILGLMSLTGLGLRRRRQV